MVYWSAVREKQRSVWRPGRFSSCSSPKRNVANTMHRGTRRSAGYHLPHAKLPAVTSFPPPLLPSFPPILLPSCHPHLLPSSRPPFLPCLEARALHPALRGALLPSCPLPPCLPPVPCIWCVVIFSRWQQMTTSAISVEGKGDAGTCSASIMRYTRDGIHVTCGIHVMDNARIMVTGNVSAVHGAHRLRRPDREPRWAQPGWAQRRSRPEVF